MYRKKKSEVVEAYKKYVADISDLGLIIKSKIVQSPLDDDALTRWQRDVGHDDAGQQDAGHQKDSPNVADSKYSYGVISLKQLKEVLVLAMKP
ncbi:unnamed protein product [Trifolium pratense]|uniref:Uncharacterized protein n=1 Tax=Trifolium pratense TaxID=57577 RepID=A0ACB0K6W8_TRIPR|nr:unnamed protein product [Trifolium pratense]